MSDSRGAGSKFVRALLWTVLLVALIGLAVAGLSGWRGQQEARVELPPVHSEVPEFSLIDRDGSVISKGELLGRPWVADFIFTRCALSCPRMTQRMVQLVDLVRELEPIRRVSFSVDPDFDTPAVLQSYAESWGIEDPDWLFLTGERQTMYELITGGFGLAVDATPPPGMASPQEPILHSTRFVLVDGEGWIRGYYAVSEREELERLAADLAAIF